MIFPLILNNKHNWAYPNIVENDAKVLYGAVIFELVDGLVIEEAIAKSESHFDRLLAKKEALLDCMEKKNITGFREFKT